MKRWVLLIFALFTLSSCTWKAKEPETFSLHLFMEPQHLDPAQSRASSASYFFYNCLRGLYKINEHNKPEEEGGRCQWQSPLQLVCELKKEKWSNGDSVVAADYLRTFRHLANPETGSPRSQLLKNLKGYEEVTTGKLSPEKLGVSAPTETRLVLDFSVKDSEFLYKLASTALYPTHPRHQADRSKAQDFIVNGPYKVKEWVEGQHLILEPNPLYTRGHPQRPLVKFLFLEDEMTAFRLYEKKQMSFLRRIPSQMIDRVKNRSDFFQKPMLRFDYIGFGPKLMEQPLLRSAMVQAIDYEKLKVLLGALERPGCPSIPKEWLVQQKCFDFDPGKAKEILNQIPEPIRNEVYQLKVSQLGGEDIKKQAEFLQNQWQTHLGLNIQISQVEQKVFLSELRQSPPDIFRKGVGMDRPTCMNALETFSEDSQQNFIELKGNQYNQWVLNMGQFEVDSLAYKKICQEAVNFLMDQSLIIPLGEMHFTMMASPSFSGWTINGMNQLDLGPLHPKSQP